jgi:ADP-heptose:LPS heptosyltransferase
VALHPGSGSSTKNWPRKLFSEVARRLSGGEGWLLVEGPADRDATEGLAQAPHSRVARDWPIRVLAAALAEARLYVGNDSGVTHLAAAVGTPTVALFGPTDPLRWSPVGPCVAVVRSPFRTMDGISVDAVMAAARELAG